MHLRHVSANHTVNKGPLMTHAMAKKMKKAPTRTTAKTTHRPQELNELDLR